MLGERCGGWVGDQWIHGGHSHAMTHPIDLLLAQCVQLGINLSLVEINKSSVLDEENWTEIT